MGSVQRGGQGFHYLRAVIFLYHFFVFPVAIAIGYKGFTSYMRVLPGLHRLCGDLVVIVVSCGLRWMVGPRFWCPVVSWCWCASVPVWWCIRWCGVVAVVTVVTVKQWYSGGDGGMLLETVAVGQLFPFVCWTTAHIRPRGTMHIFIKYGVEGGRGVWVSNHLDCAKDFLPGFAHVLDTTLETSCLHLQPCLISR